MHTRIISEQITFLDSLRSPSIHPLKLGYDHFDASERCYASLRLPGGWSRAVESIQRPMVPSSLVTRSREHRIERNTQTQSDQQWLHRPAVSQPRIPLAAYTQAIVYFAISRQSLPGNFECPTFCDVGVSKCHARNLKCKADFLCERLFMCEDASR